MSRPTPVLPVRIRLLPTRIPEVIFMSSLALNPNSNSTSSAMLTPSSSSFREDVVEVGLLLPAEWAAALIELSRKRQESVGELIRTCIGRVLTENNASL